MLPTGTATRPWCRKGGLMRFSVLRVSLLAAACLTVSAADPPKARVAVPLTVSSGVPLRVYIDHRIGIHQGTRVHAILIEPVYSFDRIVVPAGSRLDGQIREVEPVPWTTRLFAILNGDFTPLHKAKVCFDELEAPGAPAREIDTAPALGQRAIYFAVKLKPKKRSKAAKATRPQTVWQERARQEIGQQIGNQLNARTYGLAGALRGPGKLERLEEFAVMKLPWHPQWMPRGTRFDAVLQSPLSFGSASVRAADLKWVDTTLSSESLVHARLLESIDSANATRGEEIHAVMDAPLFSPQHHLLLPAGTRLTAEVTEAHPARWFHRGGQLRFAFRSIDMPHAVQQAEGQIAAAEANYAQKLKVDDEGGVQATDSKKRFLAPAISALIAAKALDRDAGKAPTAQGGNYAGRTLGGFSGFGFAGALAAQASRTAGSVFGLYGLAWSVYSNIVAKGGEVDFPRDTSLDVILGPRKPPSSPQSPERKQFAAANRAANP